MEGGFAVAVDESGGRRWGRVVLAMFGWVVGIIGVFILLLPVLLLPLTTGVPTWLWVTLLVVDLALVVLLLRHRRHSRAWGFGGMALVVAIAVVTSQLFAAPPPILNTAGHPVPNSIATLEKVNLNGSEQWITIRGRDRSNPILLNLGMGGPGGGGFATRTLFEPLEEHFTVVSWDEPGTGKSISAVPTEQLTRQRFIDDGRALTDLLRERFGQDKIFLYGVSWTSILGIWLVQDSPQYYHAFIGSGQMVNTTANDQAGYQLALEYSAQRGDQATLDRLRANGPPPYTGPGLVFRYVDYLDVLNDYMGSTRFATVVPIVPFLAPEYGYVDKVNHTRGLIDSFNVVYPQLADLDFRTQANRLEVPVYFFVGRDDVNAMASLVADYYDALSAPGKKLIWLQGGHGLTGATRGQFVAVMVKDIRPLAG